MKFSLKYLMVSILLIAHLNIISFEGWPYGLNWEKSDSFDNYNAEELTQQLIQYSKIKDNTITCIKWGTIKNSTNQSVHLQYYDTTDSDDSDDELNYTIEPGQALTHLPDPDSSFYKNTNYPSELKKTWRSTLRLVKGNEKYNALLFSVLYHCYFYGDPKDYFLVEARMEHASKNVQPYIRELISKFYVLKQEYIIDVDLKGDQGENTVISVQENLEKKVYN